MIKVKIDVRENFVFFKFGFCLNVIDVIWSWGLIINVMVGVMEGLCVVVECFVFYFVWLYYRNLLFSVGYGWMWYGSIEDEFVLSGFMEWINLILCLEMLCWLNGKINCFMWKFRKLIEFLLSVV